MFEPALNYDILKSFTNDESVVQELALYTKNTFITGKYDQLKKLQLPDEKHIESWLFYKREASENGVYETLKKYLVQFNFPVKKGISQSTAYRTATLKGQSVEGMPEATGLDLKHPELLELQIYQSPAGKVPVLIIPHERDFMTIVQALGWRNEPETLPPSMGASLVKGLNNWHRLRQLKENWLMDNPEANWMVYFQNKVLPNKSLYQDTLILLSNKPYSAVHGLEWSLSADMWAELSLKIRLEHECTHYFTLRFFGTMRNNMHDELIADYMGITKVLGTYNSSWFLRFIGLENYPLYRKGGRLENYLGQPALSVASFSILQQLLKRASDHVEAFDHSLGAPNTIPERIIRLLTLCNLTLEQMASENGVEDLLFIYKKQTSFFRNLNMPK